MSIKLVSKSRCFSGELVVIQLFSVFFCGTFWETEKCHDFAITFRSIYENYAMRLKKKKPVKCYFTGFCVFFLSFFKSFEKYLGGKGGIRTRGTVSSTTV